MQATIVQLSRQYSPLPGVTIWMLPYLPYAWSRASEQFKQQVPPAQWENLHHVFIMTLPLVTHIDSAGEVPLWFTALVQCHQVRLAEGLMAAWSLFEQVATVDALNVLWAAYTHTREELPAAPEALRQPAPVPVDGAGAENPPIAGGGTP